MLNFFTSAYTSSKFLEVVNLFKISNLLLSGFCFIPPVLLSNFATFYNEKDKIEISLENISNIKINHKNDEEIKENTSIVYLTRNQNKNSIRTIRIKKGKREIEGTFLIRGHWRRQKYLDGTKLIWIEPFWKGFGKEKQRVYKIIKK